MQRKMSFAQAYEALKKQLKNNWDKFESGTIKQIEWNRRNQIAMTFFTKETMCK